MNRKNQTSEKQNNRAANVFIFAACAPFFVATIIYLITAINQASDMRDRQTPIAWDDKRCAGESIKLRHYSACMKMFKRKKELK